MARSKTNKQMKQFAKKAAAKLKKSLGASNCDGLMAAMGQQDAKEDAENSYQRRRRSKEEDLSDDEVDSEEEEANEEEYVKAVEAIMNANIEDGTKARIPTQSGATCQVPLFKEEHKEEQEDKDSKLIIAST